MPVSLSKEPTVMASSAEPGVPIWAETKLFPAAMNKATFSSIIRFAILFTLSSSEEVHSMTPGPPSDIDAERMLNT